MFTSRHRDARRLSSKVSGPMPHLPALRARLGSELDDEDLRRLMDRMERVEGPAGFELVRHGDHNDSLHLVVEGTLVVHVDSGGRQLDLARIGPGHWIGELQFIEPGPASATVTAETDFATLRIANASLPALIQDDPMTASALFRRLQREIADRLLHTSSGVVQRIDESEFRVTDVEERHSWFAETVGRLLGREVAR